MGYKEAAVDEARRRFAPMVRELFEGFLQAHANCVASVAAGPVGCVLPVPSTSRPRGSPLGMVEGLTASIGTSLPGTGWAPLLLARAATPIGHMRPDATAFAVPASSLPQVVGQRLLLLDDLYVSGARAQSAAAALRRAGADAVVIVAAGRVLRPDRSISHARFLAGVRREPPGDPSRSLPGSCCRCVQAGAPTGACTPVNSSETRHTVAAAAESRALAEGRETRGGP